MTKVESILCRYHHLGRTRTMYDDKGRVRSTYTMRKVAPDVDMMTKIVGTTTKIESELRTMTNVL